ncbi:MAG TPA: hypothetical protein VGI87_15330 [Solirubrobacteraceae bacterium]
MNGGQLSPRLVTAPAFLAVQLTVSSGDGKSHQVVLETPAPRTLSVPASGKASVLVPGLRAGEYALKVDGSTRGGLMIGGEPGP